MAKKEPVPTKKADILASMAAAAEITKAQVELAYNRFLQIAYEGAKAEGGIVLPGLGKLSVGKRAARMGRNPFTKEPMKIKAKKIAKFKIAKACADAVTGAKK